MHKKVLYHLEKIKKELKESCSSCQGKGCNTCSSIFDAYSSFARSGIPIKYWELGLNDLGIDNPCIVEVNSFCNKLKLAYESGQGIFLYGQNGTGKTLSACHIAKQAILQGFSVRFTFLGEIISSFINTMYNSSEREKLKQDILGVDFLIIDDIDKTYVAQDSKYVNSVLDTLFRTRVQNCLPVIITSNKALQEILSSSDEVFSKSLLSLFQESLLPILFIGSDKREELKIKARQRFFDEK